MNKRTKMISLAILLLVIISTFYIRNTDEVIARIDKASDIGAKAKFLGSRGFIINPIWKKLSSPYTVNITVDSGNIGESYCINEILLYSSGSIIFKHLKNLNYCGKLISYGTNTELIFFSLDKLSISLNDDIERIEFFSGVSNKKIIFNITTNKKIAIKNWLLEMIGSA